MTPGVDRAADLAAITAGEQLAAAYRDIGRRTMRDLPVYNATLDVCAVGFRPHDGGVLGVLVTPWFMNLVVARRRRSLRRRPGATVPRRFPAGTIDFTVGEVAGGGWTAPRCSRPCSPSITRPPPALSRRPHWPRCSSPPARRPQHGPASTGGRCCSAAGGWRSGHDHGPAWQPASAR